LSFVLHRRSQPLQCNLLFSNHDKTSCIAAECGRHGITPPAACNIPFSRYGWPRHAVDSACSNRLTSLKFVGDTISVSALISLVTLTFDLETPARCCAWGLQPFYQFCCFWDFSFSSNGPKPYDLIFDFESILLIDCEVGNLPTNFGVPSLQFVRLPVRKNAHSLCRH